MARLVLALGVVLAAAAAIALVRSGSRVRPPLPVERGETALGATSVRWVGVLVLIAMIAVVSARSIGAPLPGAG